MKHGSLFSGIGGFDLAAEWMGWQNIFYCEKDRFCRKVLDHYWPNSKSYEDISQFDATEYRGLVDIISGGFPCQPFSLAGQRKGRADDRYLFPQALRIIKEARPRWVVLENVAGLFTILEPDSLSEVEHEAVELFCSNGEQVANRTIVRLQRRIIGTIISEMRAAGYVFPELADGTPIVLCVPAAAVGAPHRRDRVWFVAHAERGTDRPDKDRPGATAPLRTKEKDGRQAAVFHQGRPAGTGGGKAAHPHGDGNGPHPRDRPDEVHVGEGGQYAQHDPYTPDHHLANGRGPGGATGGGVQGDGAGQRPWRGEIPGWDGWPVEPPVCGGDDGLPDRLDHITLPKWRENSIKAYGNAIVPQVALELFRAIGAVDGDWGKEEFSSFFSHI